MNEYVVSLIITAEYQMVVYAPSEAEAPAEARRDWKTSDGRSNALLIGREKVDVTQVVEYKR